MQPLAYCAAVAECEIDSDEESRDSAQLHDDSFAESPVCGVEQWNAQDDIESVHACVLVRPCSVSGCGLPGDRPGSRISGRRRKTGRPNICTKYRDLFVIY